MKSYMLDNTLSLNQLRSLKEMKNLPPNIRTEQRREEEDD